MIFTVYFALVKADFFICVYVFLFVLEMFKYIELLYLFSVLEVFSAWRLKNQFLFTTGCVKCCTFLFIDVIVGWFVLLSVLCFRF
jgi:hypothetical protein